MRNYNDYGLSSQQYKIHTSVNQEHADRQNENELSALFVRFPIILCCYHLLLGQFRWKFQIYFLARIMSAHINVNYCERTHEATLHFENVFIYVCTAYRGSFVSHFIRIIFFHELCIIFFLFPLFQVSSLS